ncbi:MAG: biotin--[acetyl-CoA-carboxylase] ligase [Clostridiales bacterium]|jgi:BirA family biotin operon repressor/biotin-[acetyl-CoA-carboxylase] ligase|nr:biotin--[acetyl-CoA-carboxylase] ligase [Clostridiales bacterium]
MNNTKSALLALLEKNSDKSLSGEEIAGQLGVSRTAVWKAVKSLEKDGYGINAVQNRGYRLTEDNNILSVEGIIPYLKDGICAEKISVYGSLDSTNKTAKEAAINGGGHGTVIIADSQNFGKGRNGKAFFSPPLCGLYMSFILSPELYNFPEITGFTVAAAAAVCLAIKSVCGVECSIKRVNDILIDGKKICGILTEAVSDLESGATEWVVAGIGINVFASEFPEEIKNVASSVFLNKPSKNIRNLLAAEIINLLLTAPADAEFYARMQSEYDKRLINGGI